MNSVLVQIHLNSVCRKKRRKQHRTDQDKTRYLITTETFQVDRSILMLLIYWNKVDSIFPKQSADLYATDITTLLAAAPKLFANFMWHVLTCLPMEPKDVEMFKVCSVLTTNYVVTKFEFL